MKKLIILGLVVGVTLIGWRLLRKPAALVAGKGSVRIRSWQACIGPDWWNDRFPLPMVPDAPIEADGKPIYIGVQWENVGKEGMVSYCHFEVEMGGAEREVTTQTVHLDPGEVAKESTISLPNMGDGWYRIEATIYEKDQALAADWMELAVAW